MKGGPFRYRSGPPMTWGVFAIIAVLMLGVFALFRIGAWALGWFFDGGGNG